MLASPPASFSRTTSRSARRTLVRARSIAADAGDAPGSMKDRGSVTSACRSSIIPSSRAVISSERGVKCCLNVSYRLGAVASSAPTVKSSRSSSSSVLRTRSSWERGPRQPQGRDCLVRGPVGLAVDVGLRHPSPVEEARLSLIAVLRVQPPAFNQLLSRSFFANFSVTPWFATHYTTGRHGS